MYQSVEIEDALIENKTKLSYETVFSKKNNFHKVKIHKSNTQILGFLLNASLGSTFWGYSIFCYNPAQKEIQKVLEIQNESKDYNDNIVIGITCILLLGGFFGSIICTFLLKTITRRKVMIYTDFIGSFGCLFSVLYPNLYTIMIGRFIQGIAAGMNTVVVPLYIKELTPLQLIGGTSIFNPGFLFLGCFLGYLVGIGYATQKQGDHYYWRIAFAIPIIFCIIRSSFLKFKYKFDTPLSLLMKNQKQIAVELIKDMYQPEYVDDLLEDWQHEAERKLKTTKFKYLFTQKRYKKTIIISVLIYLTQFIGQNAMTFYSSRVFNEADGNKIKYSKIYSAINFTASLTGVIITMFIVQIFGKKNIVKIFSFILFLITSTLSVLWFLAYDQADYDILNNYQQINTGLSDVIIIFLILFRFNIGLGTVAPMFGYISDISSDMGLMFTKCLYWFFTIIFAIFFVKLKLYISFLIFAFNSLICFIVFTFVIKDTRNLSRKDMELLYIDRLPKYTLSLAKKLAQTFSMKTQLLLPKFENNENTTFYKTNQNKSLK